MLRNIVCCRSSTHRLPSLVASSVIGSRNARKDMATFRGNDKCHSNTSRLMCKNRVDNLCTSLHDSADA